MLLCGDEDGYGYEYGYGYSYGYGYVYGYGNGYCLVVHVSTDMHMVVVMSL